METDSLRAKAQRCRDLIRLSEDDGVRDQLRKWAEDFEDEADVIESRFRANDND